MINDGSIQYKFRRLYKIDTNSNCWNYTLIKNGKPCALCSGNSVMTPAQFSYQLKYGIFPMSAKNWIIKKTCNNPLCVNPDHLQLACKISPKITKKIPLFIYQIIKYSDLSVVELSKHVGYDPRVVFKIKDGSLSNG